jgi:hypothetical protein
VATPLTYVHVGKACLAANGLVLCKRRNAAMGADSSVGWGDGRNPNKLRCHCVGVRKLTPTYQCSIKTTLMEH